MQGQGLKRKASNRIDYTGRAKESPSSIEREGEERMDYKLEYLKLFYYIAAYDEKNKGNKDKFIEYAAI